MPQSHVYCSGKAPSPQAWSFRSLTEGLHVPRRNSAAEPSYSKAGAPDGFQRRTDLLPCTAVPILKSSSNRRRHWRLDGAAGWMVCRPHETPCQNHQAPEAWAVSDVHISGKAGWYRCAGGCWQATGLHLFYSRCLCLCLILSAATCTTQNGSPGYLLAWAETSSLLLPGACAGPDGYTRQPDYMVWSSSSCLATSLLLEKRFGWTIASSQHGLISGVPVPLLNYFVVVTSLKRFSRMSLQPLPTRTKLMSSA